MKLEIDAAAQWFAGYLCRYGLNAELADRFKNCLAKQLELKFQNHWYEDQPLRGNAYRSVTVDKRTKMDGLLEKAASEASVPDLSNQLGPLSFVMWIDPFEVAVRFFGIVSDTQVVYRSTDYKPAVLPITSSSAANHYSSTITTTTTTTIPSKHSFVQNSNHNNSTTTTTTSNTTTSGEVTPKSISPPGSFNNRRSPPPITPPLSTSPTKEYVYNNTHYYNTSPSLHHYHHNQYYNNNNNNSNTTYRRVQPGVVMPQQSYNNFDWNY
jgi:hypothetical protein